MTICMHKLSFLMVHAGTKDKLLRNNFGFFQSNLQLDQHTPPFQPVCHAAK